MRSCRVCLKSKSVEQFYKSNRQKDGLNTECKSCALARMKEYNKHYLSLESTRERLSAYRKKARTTNTTTKRREFKNALKRHYNMDVECWARLFHAQNGLCAVCSDSLDGGRHTHVDHDHRTGRVRGLLCGHCNPLIGFCKENPQRLHSALAYLERQCGG